MFIHSIMNVVVDDVLGFIINVDPVILVFVFGLMLICCMCQ